MKGKKVEELEKEEGIWRKEKGKKGKKGESRTRSKFNVINLLD